MAPSIKSDKYVNEDVSSDESGDEAFQPPKHFNKVTTSKSFKVGDKEIWLIKTPKGFPLHKVKTLPVSFTSSSIHSGAEPFKIDSSEYQVNEDVLDGDNELRKFSLISKNKIVKGKHFDRFYNIREVVQIPEIDFDKVTVARKNVRPVSRLRMRHFPTGYSAGDYDEANPELISDKEEVFESEEETIDISHITKDEAGKAIKKAKLSDDSKSKKDKKKDKKEKKEKKDKKEKKHKKKD